MPCVYGLNFDGGNNGSKNGAAVSYFVLLLFFNRGGPPTTQIQNSADTTLSRSFDSSKKEIVSKTCFSANAVTVALLRYSGFMMIKLSFITSNYVQSASRVTRLACTLAACKMAPSLPEFQRHVLVRNLSLHVKFPASRDTTLPSLSLPHCGFCGLQFSPHVSSRD